MLSKQLTRYGRVAIALIAGLVLLWTSPRTARAQGSVESDTSAHVGMLWEAQAREHRAPLRTKVQGTLTISETGLEFRSTNGSRQQWTFEDIRTAFLAPGRLELDTYTNRSWRRPGTQHFRFDLEKALPPTVATSMTARIQRPVQNADPDPKAPAIAVIPVRHRTLTRGTNGVLRFRNGGVDYVTSARGDSRSWRWADLQSLSDPSPYQLFLFGYRDTYTFDLKAPLSRALFNHATDEIYAHSDVLPEYAPGMTREPYPQQTGAR